jgi:hypothetical protein
MPVQVHDGKVIVKIDTHPRGAHKSKVYALNGRLNAMFR